MLADECKTVRVTRYWKLKSPAHNVDVAQTLTFALERAREDAAGGLNPGVVQVVAWDTDELRIQYDRDFDPKADE